MKKTLLFAAVASMAFAAGAQTVQDIPNAEPLKLDQDVYSKITINMPAEDTTDPVTGDVIPGVDKPRVVNNEKDQGIQQFDSMNDGDVAVLKLNNTQEACYVVSFETGTKQYDSSLLFEIYDGNDLEWSSDYTVARNGEWNSKFLKGMAFITDPLTVGEKTFKITFKNEQGGRASTVNLRQIVFEARESITNYSINLEVEPAGAGTVTKTPDMPLYLADTEVTINATAAKGYKFLGWEAEYESGETLTIAEAKAVVYATGNVTYYAMFEEVVMSNTIPGTISFDTRILMNGNPETKAVSVDGESYNEGAETTYLANYRAFEEGKGNNSEMFELNVTKAGSYTILAPTATKLSVEGTEPAYVTFTFYDKDAYDADPTSAEAEYTANLVAPNTGNWQKFASNKLENVALTEGPKYLYLEFHEPVTKKYTVNLLYIKMGIGDDFGDEAGIENVTVENNENVKYYNLQGIEVAPSTKGLLILSNGTKVLNK